MTDREKVIGHLNDCVEASRRENTWVFVRKDIVEDALSMLKEQSEIVRCKECKHRPTDPEKKGLGQSLVFPDDVCPCQIGDNWYSWMPKDNWYCADGKRSEVE